MLNSDMIGRMRNQQVEVHGVRTAYGLRQMLSRHNVDHGLELDFIWGVRADSDHYAFFERDIPFLMFHTGLHEDYHRASDDSQRINREGLMAVSQLMFSVAYELAESSHVAEFRSEARRESQVTRAQFERSASPVPPRLGVSWSQEDDDPGLLVTRVTPGSAADQSGLRTGDRIVEFGGRVVEHGDQFQLIVLAAVSPTVAVVRRPGEPDDVQLPVHLPGHPVRIGISWDQDQADPALVILTQVVPGSAAHRAGLAVSDRIYEVNGQTFADEAQFGPMVTKTQGSLDLLVERRGRLRHVSVEPFPPQDHSVAGDLTVATRETAAN